VVGVSDSTFASAAAATVVSDAAADVGSSADVDTRVTEKVAVATRKAASLARTRKRSGRGRR